MATDVLELECCPPDPDPFCNDSALLSCALEAVDHLKEHIRFCRQLHDWAFVRAEIDGKAPIAVRIERTEGSHAVVIHGYRGSADGILYVDDPAEDVGSNKVWYEELVSNYEGDGIWDRTYRTE